MKKLIKYSICSILLSQILFSFNSCALMEYDLTEGFFRLMKVEQRAKKLKFLSDETSINSINNDEEYDVLIITDVHVGNENHGKNGPRREDAWFDQITKVDSSTGKRIVDNVRFAICLGDVAEHGLLEECNRFNDLITTKLENITTPKAPEGIKLYNIVGNHDLYNSGWKAWSKTMYPGTSFYKFETPSFSWYFLDSASGTIGGYQYDALKSDMSNDSKRKLVFSHVPLYADDFFYFTMQNTEERNKIISTCAKNKTCFFIDGHTHAELTTDFGKFTEYNLPGFLELYGYAILHINEAEATAKLMVKYY